MWRDDTHGNIPDSATGFVAERHWRSRMGMGGLPEGNQVNEGCKTLNRRGQQRGQLRSCGDKVDEVARHWTEPVFGSQTRQEAENPTPSSPQLRVRFFPVPAENGQRRSSSMGLDLGIRRLPSPPIDRPGQTASPFTLRDGKICCQWKWNLSPRSVDRSSWACW